MKIRDKFKSVAAIPTAALIAAFAVFMLYATPAPAEGNCPDGYTPTYDPGGSGRQTGCYPLPASGGNGLAPAPGPRWEKRWGAIALDKSVSRFGGVDGYSSKRQAEKAAVAACKQNGGTKMCKSVMTYYNQCGALAWGINTATTSRAPTLDEAVNKGLAMCSAEATNCKIYYSGCSYDQRVR